MKEVDLNLLISEATKLASDRKSWHFHILTPQCLLNEIEKYALVLENATDDIIYICYSEKPYMDEGKKLVKLLHGNDIVKEEKSEDSAKLVQTHRKNTHKSKRTLRERYRLAPSHVISRLHLQ